MKAKLREETAESCESGNVEDLADVLEVIDAICEFDGFDREELDHRRESKTRKRGRFEERIVLDTVLE